MPLGIPNNKWHFIFSIIAVDLAFYVYWYFLSGLLIPDFGVFVTALIGFVFGIQVAHHLQSWNEISQALDPQVDKTYGSFERFQKDSRDDFRWFWRGIAVSWVIPLVIAML
jgi:hypothetical protein